MFDFDEVVDRKGTNCAKWDTIEAKNKPKDVLPMWVADMDFKSPKEIENALVKRIKQGVYGYSFETGTYSPSLITISLKTTALLLFVAVIKIFK